MAILEHEVRLAEKSWLTGVQRHLFSREDYYSMADAGLFRDLRVELIEGEIIEMAPIGDTHAAVTDPLGMILRVAFGESFTVRTQAPIALGGNAKPSEPQPDVAVVTGFWRDYTTRKPSPEEIKLVVEIVESTLMDDRKIKTALYASFGIPEYWIVNLRENHLEVYREPEAATYRTMTVYQAGENVQPLYASNFVVVADFMP